MVNRAEDHGIERRTYLPPGVIRMLPERLVAELYGGHLPEHIEEIRLHAGRCASVVAGGRNIMLRTVLSAQEMTATLTRMCGGSLYSHAPTIAEGYLTLDGGVRVGVCGRAACEGGEVIGVYDVSGLCIRIPAHFSVSGREICNLMQKFRYTKGVLIYAPPGVGKTTLLRLMGGLLQPGAGVIRRKPHLTVGYLPQIGKVDRNFPITAEEVVLSGLQNKKTLWQKYDAACYELVKSVMSELEVQEVAQRRIEFLSGGQWQRVLLARALVSQPDLLLLDEPDTHLDEASKALLYKMLHQRAKETATVVVSHDHHIAEFFPGGKMLTIGGE
jgi:zinc transport system ATP-binding protein